MLLFGNMFYGVVLVACNVVFTLGYWMFSESLIEIPFFQMGNGLLVFGISILQVRKFSYFKLFVSHGDGIISNTFCFRECAHCSDF